MAGSPAFETAAALAIRDVAAGAIRRPDVLPHIAGAAPGLRRRPDRVRHRLPSTCPRTTRRRRCRASEERLRQPDGLEVDLAGGPAFYGDVQAVSESDLQRSELISLPLAALALLLVFGSVVAAAVPLVVGGAAVVVALAAIFLDRDASRR